MAGGEGDGDNMNMNAVLNQLSDVMQDIERIRGEIRSNWGEEATQAEVNKWRKTASDAANDAAEAARMRDSLKMSFAEVSRELEVTKETLARTLLSLKAERKQADDLYCARTHLMSERDEARTERDEALKQRDDATEGWNNNVAVAADLRRDLSDAMRQIATLTSRIHTLHSPVSQATVERDVLRDRVTNLQYEIERANEVIGELRAALKTYDKPVKPTPEQLIAWLCDCIKRANP
jgi:chromosome segregation ATPase